MLRFLLRVTAVLFGVLLGLAMLALALVSLMALLITGLLRGRRPAVDLNGFRRAGRRMAGGDVVDVEAREVAPARDRADHQRLLDSSSKISP